MVKIKALVITLLLLAPAFAAAATFTSKATGDWSATGQTTWNETGSPGASDTVEINNGHVVDYDADFTHTGPITVYSGGTLRGDGARVLTLSNTTLTIKAGGALTNTGGVFEIKVGGAHNQASAAVMIGESSGSRATVTGASTTNHIKFTDGGFLRGGKANCQRTDFAKVGNSSTAAFQFYASAADTFSWDDCTFDADCGRIQNTTVIHADAVFVVEDNTFLATGQNLTTFLATSAIGSGTRSIQRNWFAGSLGTNAGGGQWYDATLKHNVILGGFYNNDANDYPWASTSGFNVIRWLGASGLLVKASTTTALPWYLHIHNPAAVINNCRGLSPTVYRNVTIAGWIIEPGHTDSSGDIIPSTSPSSARAWIVENNLVTLNRDGDHAGQFLSLLGNANATFTRVNHNTYPATVAGIESGGISYGETYAGHADIIGEIKSNLVWAPSSGGGYVFQRRSLSSVADGCPSGDVTHNGKWNLSTGDQGVGYDDTAGSGMFSSGSPGASDVTLSADPFVDKSRRLSTWAVDRGYSVSGDYATQCDDAYTALKTDTATRIEDLFTYVKEGWNVNDEALDGTAHDGGDPGAMQFIEPGGGGGGPVNLLSSPYVR